eukprot:Rmarinus@m.18131
MLRLRKAFRLSRGGALFSTSTSRTRLPYAQITNADVQHFRSVLGDAAVVTGKDDLEIYNTDWTGDYRGQTTLAVRPESASQVSKILSYCNERRLAVVPQGGNTGLVGGSVPVFDEIVVSLNRMNNIRAFDEISGVLTCDAGCILENLDNFVGERGYMMPIDLGAKGSCQIGGNVATNAGGIRFVRYGSLHGTVLGIEAVLPDGTVLDNLSTLRKDNTGYDLKQLFIGSEGSLGIITGLNILCPTRPRAVQAAFLACETFDDVRRILRMAKTELSEVLSAFEFLDREALEAATSNLPGVRDPLPDTPGKFYTLIEVSGSSAEHNEEKLSMFLEKAMECGAVTDGAVAQDENHSAMFWRIREGMPEAMSKVGMTFKYDFSLPLDSFYTIVRDTRERIRDCEGALVVAWGHVGDCNLHLNIAVPREQNEMQGRVRDLLSPFLFEKVREYHGSISAEHGLGLMKAGAIHYRQNATSVNVMQRLRKMIDPNSIMNPYKYVLPENKE